MIHPSSFILGFELAQRPVSTFDQRIRPVGRDRLATRITWLIALYVRRKPLDQAREMPKKLGRNGRY